MNRSSLFLNHSKSFLTAFAACLSSGFAVAQTSVAAELDTSLSLRATTPTVVQGSSLVRLERESFLGYDIFLPDTAAVERYAGLEVSAEAKGFVVHVDASGLAEGASSQILSWQGLQLALTRQSGLLSLWAWMDEQNEWQLVVEQLPESFQGNHRFFQLCVVHFPTLEGPEQFALAIDGRPIALQDTVKPQTSARILKLFDETKGSIRFTRFQELSEYPKSMVRHDASLRARHQFETGENLEPEAPRLNPYRDVLGGSMAFRLAISPGDLSYEEEAHLMSHTVDREFWQLDEAVHSLSALQKYTAATEPAVSDILPGFWAKDWDEPWAVRNFDDQYAQRLTAYLRPEVSGDYVFWLEADEAAEVMISAPDDFETWSTLVTTEQQSQNLVRLDQPELYRSGVVYLEAGRLYLLEALHYETIGDDFFSLSWTPPGFLQDGPTERIPAQVLSAPSTGQPGTMPRWLYPAGQELLPDASEIPLRKTSRSTDKQARSASGTITWNQTIRLSDFDTHNNWASHQAMGSMFSNAVNFPWIYWSGQWIYYWGGSPQSFTRSDNDESFKIVGPPNGQIMYYPYFTGSTMPSTTDSTVDYGDSFTVSTPSQKYSLSYQWLQDGSSVTGWSSINTSYTVSSMTSADAGGYSVKISNPAGTIQSGSRQIEFAKADQSAVNISSVPSSLGYGAKDTLSASGGNAGAYSYEVHSSDSTRGRIVNTNQVEALASSGTVRVRAVRAGDSNYNPQQSAWDSITLIKGEQATVNITSVPSSLGYGAKDTLDASGGDAGAYSYEVHPSDITRGRIVNTNQVEALASSGTVRVRAVRAGNSDYNPQESAWDSITLTKASQSAPTLITPTTAQKGVDQDFSASGGGGYGSLQWQRSANGGNWQTFTNPLFISSGWSSLSVRARWSGAGNYNASSWSSAQSVSISKATPAYAPTLAFDDAVRLEQFNTSVSNTSPSGPAIIEYATSAFGWTVLSGDITIAVDWEWLNLRAKWAATGDFLESHYSETYDVPIHGARQSEPSQISSTSFVRNSLTEFSVTGGGNKGTAIFNVSSDGVNWQSAYSLFDIPSDWASLYVRAKWSGDEQYRPSGWSTSYLVPLQPLDQDPPQIIGPGYFEVGTSTQLRADGGGSYGPAQFQVLNGGSWVTLSGNSYTPQSEGDFTVRARWQGNSAYNPSAYSEPFVFEAVSTPSSFVDLNFDVPSNIMAALHTSGTGRSSSTIGGGLEISPMQAVTQSTNYTSVDDIEISNYRYTTSPQSSVPGYISFDIRSTDLEDVSVRILPYIDSAVGKIFADVLSFVEHVFVATPEFQTIVIPFDGRSIWNSNLVNPKLGLRFYNPSTSEDRVFGRGVYSSPADPVALANLGSLNKQARADLTFSNPDPIGGLDQGFKFNFQRVSFNRLTNTLWQPLKMDVNKSHHFEIPISHIVPSDAAGVGNAVLKLYKDTIQENNLIAEIPLDSNMSGSFSQSVVISQDVFSPEDNGNLYFVLSADGDNESFNNVLIIPYQSMPIVRNLGRAGAGTSNHLNENSQGFLNLDFFANSIDGSSPPDNDWFAVQAWSYTDGWNQVYDWYHAVNASPTNFPPGDAYSIEFDGVNRIEIDGNNVTTPSDYSLQSWWGTRVWLVFHSYTTGERDFLSLEAPPPSVNFKYDSDNDGIFEEIPSNTLDLPPPSSSIHKLEFGTNFPALPNDGGLKVSINPYGHYKIYSDPAGNDNIMDRFLLPDYDEKSFDLSNSSERSEIQNLVSNGIYVEPLVSTMVRNSSSLGIEITDNANRVISSVSLNLTIEEPKMQIPTQIDNLLTAPSKPDLANLRSRLRNEFAVFQSSKMSRLNPNLIGMAPRFGNLDMIAQYIYINPAPSLSTLKQISSNIKTHTGATYKSQISAEQAVVGILYHEVLEKDIQNGLRVVPPSQTPSGFSFDAGKVTSLKREAWVRFETDRFLIRVGYPTFYPPAWSHQDFVDFVFKLEKASSSQHGVGGERRRIKPNENSLKVFEKDYHLKFYFDRIIWTFPPAP